MSRVCKPMQVDAMGAYRYGHGLEFSNPRPTRTHDAGTAGLYMNATCSMGIQRYPANIERQRRWQTFLNPTVQYLWH